MSVDPPRIADQTSTAFIIVSCCSIAAYIYLASLTFSSKRTRLTSVLLMMFVVEMCLQIVTVPSAIKWGSNVPNATGNSWCITQSILRAFFLHLMTGSQAIVLYAVWQSIDTRTKWSQFNLKQAVALLFAICVLLQVIDIAVEATHGTNIGVRGGRLYCDTTPDFALYLKQGALLVSASFGLFISALTTYAFIQHYRSCRNKRVSSNLPISLFVRILAMCGLFIVFSLWQPIARFQQAATHTAPANQKPITEFMTASWGLVTLAIFSPMTTKLVSSIISKLFPNWILSSKKGNTTINSTKPQKSKSKSKYLYSSSHPYKQQESSDVIPWTMQSHIENLVPDNFVKVETHQDTDAVTSITSIASYSAEDIIEPVRVHIPMDRLHRSSRAVVCPWEASPNDPRL